MRKSRMQMSSVNENGLLPQKGEPRRSIEMPVDEIRAMSHEQARHEDLS